MNMYKYIITNIKDHFFRYVDVMFNAIFLLDPNSYWSTSRACSLHAEKVTLVNDLLSETRKKNKI